MILAALRHASGHLTASQIYDEVVAEYPYVDISTVYRTLAVLKDLRLVSEIDMGIGDLSYEWVPREGRHHHLICRGCGAASSLDHHYLEDVGAEILEESGFRPDLDHFAIFGLCAACLKRDPKPTPNGSVS
jgi:Fur family ferric uptake transcriptional regulator